MAKVTTRINDPHLIARFAEFKRLKGTFPDEPRLCPKHNEPVSASELPFNNHGAMTPNFEIVFSDCCEEALRQEFEFIHKTLTEQKRGDA